MVGVGEVDAGAEPGGDRAVADELLAVGASVRHDADREGRSGSRSVAQKRLAGFRLTVREQVIRFPLDARDSGSLMGLAAADRVGFPVPAALLPGVERGHSLASLRLGIQLRLQLRFQNAGWSLRGPTAALRPSCWGGLDGRWR